MWPDNVGRCIRTAPGPDRGARLLQSVQKGRWMAVTAVAISIVFVPLLVYGVVFV